MTSHDDVRRSVSEAYARAANAPVDSCCSSSCCVEESGGGTATTTTVAESKSAAKPATAEINTAYTNEELADLPPDAVVHSLGCGNPLAFSEVQPGDVVLDLGSGAGIDLLLAAAKVGPTGRVIGVDMTGAMNERARENIAAAGMENVEVREGLIESLPVEDDSVDWVISNCVINLSPEKDRVFAEIARVLKPGARMLVSDIVVEQLPEKFRGETAVYTGCVGGAISESAYLDGLRQAGLTKLEVRARHVYTAAQLNSLVAPSGNGEAEGCCGTYKFSHDEAQELAQSLEGDVWSAQIFGRKA